MGKKQWTHQRYPHDAGKHSGNENRSAAEIFGRFRQWMSVVRDPIDGGFDGGVEDFDDKDCHDTADKKKLLHDVEGKRQRQRDRDRKYPALQSDRWFVPRGPQARDRIAKSNS